LVCSAWHSPPAPASANPNPKALPTSQTLCIVACRARCPRGNLLDSNGSSVPNLTKSGFTFPPWCRARSFRRAVGISLCLFNGRGVPEN
jgi:hypothetical protein